MQKVTIKNRRNLDIYINLTKNLNAKGLVVIQHGLSGYKEEPQLQAIADTFIKQNYTTVIFDATNSTGESESDESGITFTGHYQDLEDVVNRAKAQQRYQEPFILLGHSLGGMSVIYYTENHPKEIRLLFPLAPLISGKNFIESRKRRSLKDFQQREKDGYYIKTSSSGRKPLKIPFTLVTDLLKYDCNTLSDMILCPTIFINGDKDDSVPVPNTKAFYEVLKCPKELYILADCEHTMRTNKNLQDIENIVQKYL